LSPASTDKNQRFGAFAQQWSAIFAAEQPGMRLALSQRRRNSCASMCHEGVSHP
jgi:hypothetical protein